MYKHSSYNTVIGKSINLSKIDSTIKKSITFDRVHNTKLNLLNSNNVKLFLITGETPSESNIPLFNHPYSFNFSTVEYMCVDVRPFIKPRQDISIENMKNLIRNKVEYNMLVDRMLLETSIVDNGYNKVNGVIQYTGVVYGNWLANNISNRYTLDPRERLVVYTIAYLHYSKLFQESYKKIDMDVFNYKVSKAINLPVKFVKEITSGLLDIEPTLINLCNTIKEKVEGYKLVNFNAGALVDIISNSWYGINNRELVAVALEHIPTWIALVKTALEAKTYKNSNIAQVAITHSKRGVGDEFIRKYNDIVGDYKNGMGFEEIDNIKPFEIKKS